MSNQFNFKYTAPTEEERKEIDSMLNSGVNISSKQKINYRIMRFFPSVYGFLYKFYNKIRVPNWDVSSED